MKLFSRTKYGNKRIINFLGYQLFKYVKNKQIDKHDKIFNKLKKYHYILNSTSEDNSYVEPKNYVWQLWLQGENNAPEIIKISLDSVKKYCSDLNRVLLTEDNLKDYIQLPKYIEEKYQKGIITKAHLSDYIRLCLLEKYGGTWIDASCYMTNNIPNEILKSEFFQFKNSTYCEFSNITFLYNRELLERLYPNKFFYHTGSSWFLHSNPKNILVTKVKRFIEEYWTCENKLLDYFLFHYILAYCVLNDKECLNIFYKSPTISNFYPHVLQKMFYEKYEEKDFNDIKNNSFIHKLYWKDLKTNGANNYLNHILNNYIGENNVDF